MTHSPDQGRPPDQPGFLHEESIRARAHQKWLEKGQPAGSSEQDWLDAVAECLQESRQIETKPELLQSILHHTTAVIYVKDLQGRYLFVNRRHERIFHRPIEQVAGKTDYELFPDEVATALRANDRQVLAANRPVEFEEEVFQDDGPHTYLSLKFPLVNDKGLAYAVCGISTDITPRVRLARRLAAEHAVARVLAEASGLTEAAPRVLRAVGEQLGCRAGSLWRLDDAHEQLWCVDYWHDPAAPAPAFEAVTRRLLGKRDRNLPGLVWAAQSALWFDNYSKDERFPRAPTADREGLHCAFAVPIRAGANVLGVLEFFGAQPCPRDDRLLEVLEDLGCQVGQFIERRRAEKSLHERNVELRLAQRIQQGFYPKGPPILPGFEIAAVSRPAQETGGDYLDFVTLGGSSLGLVIGDASGHGVGASLLMAVTRAYLRAFALTGVPFADTLAFLNRALAEDTGLEYFVTLFLGKLDRATRTLAYASAGHLPAFVIDRDGQVRHTLDSTGIPLGLEPNDSPTLGVAVRLEPGDLLFLLTDGISEAFGPDGKQYGLPRAVEFVRRRRHLPPEQLLQALLDDVASYSGDTPQADDRSALVLRVRDDG